MSFKLSEMPSAKDVKFAIFPFYFCVFFKVCTRTKNKDLHENKNTKIYKKLFFQRMVNESKKQKKTSEHVIKVMKSS